LLATQQLFVTACREDFKGEQKRASKGGQDLMGIDLEQDGGFLV